MSPSGTASLLRLSVSGGLISITSTPPGHARCMMCHTTPPEGIEPLRHSITRSLSALSRWRILPKAGKLPEARRIFREELRLRVLCPST